MVALPKVLPPTRREMSSEMARKLLGVSMALVAPWPPLAPIRATPTGTWVMLGLGISRRPAICILSPAMAAPCSGTMITATLRPDCSSEVRN
ncbi:hypothetical protein D3C81_1887550 [compost metagenome]